MFKDIVLKNPEYVKMITSDTYTHRTCYMGMVDEQNQVNFYDGKIRVVDCNGKEVCKFAAQQYRDYVAEHVEPWSYMKFTFLKQRGWNGFTEGPDTGMYAVAPLARLNAAGGHGHAAGPGGRTRSSTRRSAASRCTTRWPPTGRA